MKQTLEHVVPEWLILLANLSTTMSVLPHRLRFNDVYMLAVFGDNGHWQRALAGSRAHTACEALTLHPVQCSEVMLRYYTHFLAHRSSGCFHILEIGDGDRALPGGVQRLFAPGFTVEPDPSPPGMLDRTFAATFMKRAFDYDAPASLLDEASRGQLPTCLFNPRTDHPVQADCFELPCPAVRARAGWTIDPTEPACRRCGTKGG